MHQLKAIIRRIWFTNTDVHWTRATGKQGPLSNEGQVPCPLPLDYPTSFRAGVHDNLIYLFIYLFIYLIIYLMKTCSPVNRTLVTSGIFA